MIYTIQLEVNEDFINSSKQLEETLDEVFNHAKGIIDFEVMNAFRFKEF